MNSELVQEIFFWLQFSALTIANLLVLVLLLFALWAFFAGITLNNKIRQLLDILEENAIIFLDNGSKAFDKVGMATSGLANILGFFTLRRQKKGFEALIDAFLRR